MKTMPPRPQPSGMTLSELRRLMREAGVDSQAELARRLKVHPVTVWRWFQGRVPINKAVAALVRETLKNKAV